MGRCFRENYEPLICLPQCDAASHTSAACDYRCTLHKIHDFPVVTADYDAHVVTVYNTHNVIHSTNTNERVLWPLNRFGVDYFSCNSWILMSVRKRGNGITNTGRSYVLFQQTDSLTLHKNNTNKTIIHQSCIWLLQVSRHFLFRWLKPALNCSLDVTYTMRCCQTARQSCRILSHKYYICIMRLSFTFCDLFL